MSECREQSSGGVPVVCFESSCFEVPIKGAAPAAAGLGFENGEVVPVAGFDFGALDSPEDFCREWLAEGKPVLGLVDLLFREREMEARCEGARGVLCEVIGAKKPRQMAYMLALACGLDVLEGWCQADVARRVGVRKQAINQTVAGLRARLGLRKSSGMRGEEARRNMSRRNFRKSSTPDGRSSTPDGRGETEKVGI